MRRLLPLLLVPLIALLGGCGSHHHAGLPPKIVERAHALQRKAVSACPLTPSEVAHHTGHQMGDCVPRAQKVTRGPPTLSGETGPDLSNNDPTYNWRAIRAHGHRYGWVKISEGTGFRDSTAPGMIASAKGAGVIIGGYLFSHVCLVSPYAEASKFVGLVRSYHTTGRWILDTEYGGCSTQGATRSWIATEYHAVESALNVPGGDYTGGWWSDPHAGCLFCTLDAVAKLGRPLAWISGYPSASPISGRRCNDVHQFTDHGYNGSNTGDMSVLVCASLNDVRASQAPPPKPVDMHKAITRCNELNKFRDRKAHKGHLDPYGTGRVRSLHHYFGKRHEHRKFVYVCHFARSSKLYGNHVERRAV